MFQDESAGNWLAKRIVVVFKAKDSVHQRRQLDEPAQVQQINSSSCSIWTSIFVWLWLEVIRSRQSWHRTATGKQHHLIVWPHKYTHRAKTSRCSRIWQVAKVEPKHQTQKRSLRAWQLHLYRENQHDPVQRNKQTARLVSNYQSRHVQSTCQVRVTNCAVQLRRMHASSSWSNLSAWRILKVPLRIRYYASRCVAGIARANMSELRPSCSECMISRSCYAFECRSCSHNIRKCSVYTTNKILATVLRRHKSRVYFIIVECKHKVWQPQVNRNQVQLFWVRLAVRALWAARTQFNVVSKFD